MNKLAKIPFEIFHGLYSKLNVASRYDEEFLYELFNSLIEAYNNSDFENIDVSDLSMGVYFVRIRLKEGDVFIEKIVVK